MGSCLAALLSDARSLPAPAPPAGALSDGGRLKASCCSSSCRKWWAGRAGAGWPGLPAEPCVRQPALPLLAAATARRLAAACCGGAAAATLGPGPSWLRWPRGGLARGRPARARPATSAAAAWATHRNVTHKAAAGQARCCKARSKRSRKGGKARGKGKRQGNRSRLWNRSGVMACGRRWVPMRQPRNTFLGLLGALPREKGTFNAARGVG